MKFNISNFTFGVVFFSLLSGAAFAAAQEQPPKENVTASSTAPIPLKDVQRFGTALQIIKNYYVEPVADQKLFENAIRGMLGGLDPHSSFLNEDDLRDLRDMTSGAFSGIGIEIIPSDGYLKVISPLDASPAQKAGIKPGDIIIRIDNTLVKDMTVREAVMKMRGKKGTGVTLTLVRKGETKPLSLTVVRDDIRLKSVVSKMLDGNYGYIRISSFQADTLTSLREAVSNLKTEAHGRLKGLVLDLRNDPGGLLDAAVDVTDDFLETVSMGANKMIVYTKSSLPNSRLTLNATPGDILNGAPMVVLINGGSASGAEIVAGALQDHKRAIIVGTNSFGKGSVQTVIPLDGSSAIKLTTALYYTPLGRSIQASGIKPDIIIDDLKVKTVAKNDEEQFPDVKEADLKGHLANGNKASTEAGNNAALVEDTPSGHKLAVNDYQLFEALNILKTIATLGNKPQ